MHSQDLGCSPAPPAVSTAQIGGRKPAQPAPLDDPGGVRLAAPAGSDTQPAKTASGKLSAPASGVLSLSLGGDAERAHRTGRDIVRALMAEHVLPAAEAAADAAADAHAKSSVPASGVPNLSLGAEAQPEPRQYVPRRARADSSIACEPAGQPQAERPDSVPDAAAADLQSCPRAEPEAPAAVVPDDTMKAGAQQSDAASSAEAGVPAAKVLHDPPQATGAAPQQCCDAAADVPVAETTDPAPQSACAVAVDAHAMPGQRRPVMITAEELSDMRRRLEQQPHDLLSPTTRDSQHADTAVHEPAAQPETPVPSRLTPASPSDTTDISQDEPTAQTPPVARGKQEHQSFALPAVGAGADAGAEAEAAQEQPASCALLQQAQTQSQAAPAGGQATAVSGGQRADAALQAAAAPVAGPAEEPAREAATPRAPQSVQQAAVEPDVGHVVLVPALAVGRVAAVIPSQPLAARTAAQAAPSGSPAQGDDQDPLCFPVTAHTSAQPIQQEVGQHGPAHAPAAAGASQQVMPPALQQPDNADGISVDDVDIEASDMEAEPADEDGAAAALLAHTALQKEARVLLAPVAGCSRAVPQHAVVLMASVWASASAHPSGVDAINGLAGAMQQRRVRAACWADQAEQRGCARAMSWADVTSLVGLLSPADCVETPQVGLSACWAIASPTAITCVMEA